MKALLIIATTIYVGSWLLVVVWLGLIASLMIGFNDGKVAAWPIVAGAAGLFVSKGLLRRLPRFGATR